jgi:hypothetical protein
MERPICTVCRQRFRAIAYYRTNEQVQYRKCCDVCSKKKRQQKPPVPRWQSAGYKKKSACDRCGFRARFASQLLVYHCDGNLHNTSIPNLKTICLNCVEEVKRLEVPWLPSDLRPDV